jgi:hypothetical protein
MKNITKKTIIEEAAEKFTQIWFQNNAFTKDLFIEGAKWQQEQDKNKYSEEDMREAYKYGRIYDMLDFDEWFEQFKNK